MHTVRTGEPAFPRQLGRAFWADLSADSGGAASCDALMGARLEADAPAVAAAYPWGALGHVVDLGGGNASLLVAILRAHNELRGTVIDLTGPVARAEEAIAAARAWAAGPTPGPAASSMPFRPERAATCSRGSSTKRTRDQLGELTRAARLQVSSVMPAGARSIIELRPSH